MKIIKNIKDFYKILALLSSIKNIWEDYMESKKGIFSSEFLITVLGIVGSMAAFFMGRLSPEMLAMVTTVLGAVYTIGRVVVKATKSIKDDEILAIIERSILAKIGMKTDQK